MNKWTKRRWAYTIFSVEFDPGGKGYQRKCFEESNNIIGARSERFCQLSIINDAQRQNI